MSNPTLYDDDILLWSEQQAAAIRKLGSRRRDLPNELDIENVAEEIESVGRTELAAVKSYLRQIFLHLVKLTLEARSQAVPHWRGEIVGFHANMMGRYAPSMRQRIDIDELWRSAREQTMLGSEDAQQHLVAELPIQSPFTLDDFITERVDIPRLTKRLHDNKPLANG